MAAGLDGIPAEILKAGGETTALKNIIGYVSESSEYPGELVQCEIILYATKSAGECRNIVEFVMIA